MNIVLVEKQILFVKKCLTKYGGLMAIFLYLTFELINKTVDETIN